VIKISFKGNNLVHLTKSIMDALSLLYVIHDLKPVCRITLKTKQINKLIKFCHRNKLFYQISDFKVVSIREKSLSGYSNKAVYVDKSEKQGAWFIFISKRKELLDNDFLKISDRELGKLFGYPDCCIQFYEQNISKASLNNMEFSYFIKQEQIENPFYLNIFMRYDGIALLEHFPCSDNCQQSYILAKNKFDFLKEHYPDIAEVIKKKLAIFVIFTGDNGVYYTDQFHCEKSLFSKRIRLKKIKCSFKGKLYQTIMREKTVDIIDPGKIKIGSHIYYGNKLKTVIYKDMSFV
jgi:hypothetical protein